MLRFRRHCVGLLLVVCGCVTVRGAKAEPPSSLPEHAHLRRPAAAAWLDPDRICVVADRRSGSLSRVDVQHRRVLDESAVAARLADLVPFGHAGRLLVLDDKSHELIVVHYDEQGQIVFDGRTGVSSYPVKVVVSPQGTEAAVACLWSRSIDVVALRPSESTDPAQLWNAAFPRRIATITLPFAPREIAFLPDGERLVALDAFGGRLATIDWKERKVSALHRLDGHNLHGLAVDVERRTIAIVGQHLDQRLPTDEQHLKSGALLKNRLWRVNYERLCEPMPLADDAIETVELDQTGIGAGDPSAIVPTAHDESLVCLGGTAQLAVIDASGTIRRRHDVGQRPVAVLLGDRQAVVVNQLSDSVSLVDLATHRVDEIALGPQPESYPRDRGEALFFDARLSPGGFMSCHSCHPDGHANGLLADTLGDGAYGNPKRVLSLMGTALTDHWSWNGQLRELRDQVRQSFETTMHAAPLQPEQHDDVVAFLHTLPLLPPAEPLPRDEVDRKLLERGRSLFDAWKCGDCHVGPLTYTSQGTYDVGLRDERGQAKFNPPSLRGVGHGTAFFHDNRAETLDEVLHTYRHQLPDDAAENDLSALIRFLRSL